jgi:hypothetical protein
MALATEAFAASAKTDNYKINSAKRKAPENRGLSSAVRI